MTLSDTLSGRQAGAFLRCGWQDNPALVRYLKTDWQADSWNVWHDRDRITGGDTFTAEIEEGIRWCNVLIAVMEPHATRRAGHPRQPQPPRQHLSPRDQYGRRRQGHGRLVPGLALNCTPPLLLQGLDYIDIAHQSDDAGHEISTRNDGGAIFLQTNSHAPLARFPVGSTSKASMARPGPGVRVRRRICSGWKE
jgi:hypothetical protein